MMSEAEKNIKRIYQMINAESDDRNESAGRHKGAFTVKELAKFSGKSDRWARDFIASLRERGLCKHIDDFAHKRGVTGRIISTPLYMFVSTSCHD